jgi:hypothetical protein
MLGEVDPDLREGRERKGERWRERGGRGSRRKRKGVREAVCEKLRRRKLVYQFIDKKVYQCIDK